MYYPYVPHYRQPEPNVKRRTLRVTGEGSVSVQPDIARVQLEVITESESLRQAQQENAQTMSQVINALLNLGLEREDIQTTAFNITPTYDYVDGQQVFRGYEVRNQITVEVSAIDQVGNIIDVAVQNGVNRVSNIRFTVQNRQLYYQQALVSALENARAKAQTINETMQLNLDPTPVRIVERVIDTPITYSTLTVAAESFTTPIEPGESVIIAKVEVHFRY
ncbi:SIMPL domain-containing protein [Oceanobacillus damuensis]|uniref:SIMPL domain-containing protein n=1 Tax=Oceanobacillus damuensis TaxID=937928 RepID=UPI0008362B3A|nr:SIMPL domain-containing protein [Oceanobacillus damuensis]